MEQGSAAMFCWSIVLHIHNALSRKLTWEIAGRKLLLSNNHNGILHEKYMISLLAFLVSQQQFVATCTNYARKKCISIESLMTLFFFCVVIRMNSYWWFKPFFFVVENMLSKWYYSDHCILSWKQIYRI